MNRFRNKRLVPTLALLIIASGAILQGCDCGKSSGGLQPIPDWICADEGTRPDTTEEACPSGGRYAHGSCMEARCDGEDGDSCCPGMFCATGGLCIVPVGPLTLCDHDGQCDVDGQLCLDRPRVSTESKTCGFPPLDENGNCETGAPFNQRCLKLAPCGGGCNEGWICNIDTNDCEEVPDLVTDASCKQACGDSNILVYADPETMLFDQCCEVACECLTLPPLEPGVFGRFSSLTKDGDELVLSSYDTTYGDLVVTTHDAASGVRESIKYVDGVPTSGSSVADPGGPRGGVISAGPDRGQHTSIVLSDNGTAVVYYDVDNQNLKFAQYDASTEEWATSAIHESEGEDDVGRYTSAAIDSDDIIHVSYYAHRINHILSEGAEATVVTGPFYARSKNANPSGPSDWDIIPIEVVPSCHGTCSSTQACIEVGGQPVCVAASTSCDSCESYQSCVNDGSAHCETGLPENLGVPCGGTCTDTQACVQNPNGQASCLPTADDCSPCTEGTTCVDIGGGTHNCQMTTTYPSSAGLPEGVGLFTSLALFENRPIVSYYDRARRHLRGAQAQFEADGDISTGFVSTALVSESNNDIGQQASLAVNPSDTSFSITYQALGGETLWVFEGNDLLDLTGTTSLIDDGIRESQINLVGASSSPAYDSAGNLFVAYADQTNNDLVLAYPTDDGWKNTIVLEEGAAGSFTNMVIEGQTAYISTYVRLRDNVDRDISQLSISVVDLDTLE